jgi:hypothetical protein
MLQFSPIGLKIKVISDLPTWFKLINQAQPGMKQKRRLVKRTALSACIKCQLLLLDQALSHFRCSVRSNNDVCSTF